MSSNEQMLFEKLKALPEQQRAEVEDFVGFLATKARKRAAIDRVRIVLVTLATLLLPVTTFGPMLQLTN